MSENLEQPHALPSAGAMHIAEGEDGWQKIPIDCPMLEAVAKLRVRNENILQQRDTLQAKVAELERGLKNHERVQEVCNQLFRDAAKQVEHLWLEAERPVGIQMICRKVTALETALREGLRMNFARSDRKPHHQLEEFKRIANAALGEKEAG